MSHMGNNNSGGGRSQTFNVAGTNSRFMSERERDAARQEAMMNPNLGNVEDMDEDDDMIPMGNMYNQPGGAANG